MYTGRKREGERGGEKKRGGEMRGGAGEGRDGERKGGEEIPDSTKDPLIHMNNSA